MKLPKLKELSPVQQNIYSSLSKAKQRCTNPNHHVYERYGGRGIKYLIDESKSRIWIVLQQEKAYRLAMKKYPNELITINRKDNDGDYVEDNIEWISDKENKKQMNRYYGGNPNPEKPVVDCRGNWFKSASEAERQTGIHQGNISACCRGERKSAGKYADGTKRVWKYVEKTT